MLDSVFSFGALVIALLAVLLTVVFMKWYSNRNHDYWKKKGVPHVEPSPFVGNALEFNTKPFHDILLERHQKLGPVHGFYEGNTPLLSVADPSLLRDILIKDFGNFSSRRIYYTGNDVVDKMLSVIRGEDWKRIRSIVTPTFSTGKLKKMLSIFKDCSETLVDNFKKAARKGETIDAKKYYGAFTMDIIASTAFSTKIDCHNDPDNEFAKTARGNFAGNLGWKITLLTTAPWLLKLMRVSIVDDNAINFFKRMTLQIMEERKRTGQVRNDFLQLLMDTAKEVSEEENTDKDKDIASNYAEHNAGHQLFKAKHSKSLSMDELVAQCVIFFLAGYDTTSNTLSFASYLLATNPEVQDKLRAEVDEAIIQNDGKLTYEIIQDMKYLDNVISETLRIYPPGIRLERMADAEYKLGNTGITLPKGMMLIVPVYAMQRDPKHFPEPEKFDPDRFLPQEKAKRDPYAYMPFGAGPRNCVAMRFALMEIKIVLAYVIASCKLCQCPETKVPLEFYAGQQGVLKPKEIALTVEERKDSPLLK